MSTSKKELSEVPYPPPEWTYSSNKSKAWGLIIPAHNYFPRFDSIVKRKLEARGLELKADGSCSSTCKSFTICSKDQSHLWKKDIIDIISEQYVIKYELILQKRSDDWLKDKVPLDILLDDWKKIHR